MGDAEREEHGGERPPDPSASPFPRPEVMTGYPLSPDEQRSVDEAAKGDEEEDQG